MLGEPVGSAPIGIPAIRAGMVAQLVRSPGAREELEDLIDGDLGPFLEGADQWTTVYTLDFTRLRELVARYPKFEATGGVN